MGALPPQYDLCQVQPRLLLALPEAMETNAQGLLQLLRHGESQDHVTMIALSRPDKSKPDQIGSDQTRPDLIPSNYTRLDQIRSNQTRQEQNFISPAGEQGSAAGEEVSGLQ